MPFRPFYSCWYHKLNLDRKGRLFLNYIYYGNQLGGDDLAAYRVKWPDEEIKLQPGSREKHGWWDGVKAHDPAILMSDDGGDSWRLALSADFAGGILEGGRE